MISIVQTGQHVVNIEAGPASRTPAGDAFTAVLGQVIGLTRRFTTAGEALAKPAGQTLARWLVLGAVQDAPATVAQVARILHLARQGVQRLADLLVRDGLAVYQDNPAHRRAKLLRITPHGRASLPTRWPCPTPSCGSSSTPMTALLPPSTHDPSARPRGWRSSCLASADQRKTSSQCLRCCVPLGTASSASISADSLSPLAQLSPTRTPWRPLPGISWL